MWQKWKFKIGIFFLIINIPLGYCGIGFGVALHAKTHRFFWEYVGIGIYIFSWVILGLGALMAGPEGVRLSKEIWGKMKSKFKKHREYNQKDKSP